MILTLHLSRRLFSLAIITVVAANGTARADEAAEADAAIAKGIDCRRQGHDREALTEFQRAAAIKRTPRAVAQIALAEQALGLWIPAENHLQEALDHHDDPWIQKNVQTFEDALRFIRSHLGSVEVWGSPAGAEVLLDGQVVGTLPMEHPVRVANSEVTLQVRSKGYASITRTLEVPRGQYSVREQVDLHPLLARDVAGARAVAATTEDAPAGEPARPIDLTTQPKADNTDEPSVRPIYRKTWFWVVVGAGLAAVAGTVAVLATRGTGYPSVQSSSRFNRP